MRGGALAVVVTCFAVLLGQGAASAAPDRDRLRIPETSTNAKVVRVPARAGTLAIGSGLTNTVYTWDRGDPPCDATGSTVYAGHAWRSGPGTADRWGTLRRGDTIRLDRCSFTVTHREFWSATRPIGRLFSVSGPGRIVLIGCKVGDYSKRTMVFARLTNR
ncbi:class F sortase [Nocardioides currus]|uniref:Class F sortase n=1 Tax=Nocardioides currus TaxID=2133958 RepID=A0A2R7YUI4_9ACTN|nr:class F sortase [Nocardioides currus]PUA79991.1 hypothetical protein C7S10_15645 [Nocardioides currus]